MDKADKVYRDQSTADFWIHEYRQGRPTAPSSLFERIFEYHAGQGGRFDVAHDIGGGAGLHASRLGSRFRSVILTDPSATALDVARQTLLPNLETEYKFVSGTAEEAIQPASSVDLALVANAMNWIDVDDGFVEFHRQLRPGGTLVVTNFHWIVLDDEAAQRIWLKTVSGLIDAVALKTKTDMNLVHYKFATGIDWYEFPRDKWAAGVKRCKFNTRGDLLAFVTHPHWMRGYGEYSKVRPEDVVCEEEYPGWKTEFDMAFLRAYLRSMVPVNSEHGNFYKESTEEGLRKLEDMAGQKPFEGRCPVQLILATKKR